MAVVHVPCSLRSPSRLRRMIMLALIAVVWLGTTTALHVMLVSTEEAQATPPPVGGNDCTWAETESGTGSHCAGCGQDGTTGSKATSDDNPDSSGMAGNVVFAAGFSFAVVGALTAFVMNTLRRAYHYFLNRFVCTVTMTNHEPQFAAVLLWMATQKTSLSGTNVVVQAVKDGSNDSWAMSKIDEESTLQFLPGNGSHVVYYKGKLLWVERTMQDITTAGWERDAVKLETLTLSYVGRDATLFSSLLTDAMALKEDARHDKTHVWEMHQWGFWVKAHSRDPRKLSSVILDRDVGGELTRDAQRFFDSEDWYAKRGIPYRRGYLLYGPPGCGKTTFVTALAGALKRSICVLTLASKQLSDEGLRRMLQSAPMRSIMLLEDVDAVFTGRATTDSRQGTGVTFSGLLNAVDGVASQEGRLLFLTTNHIERLDPALIRPGRCDVHVKFDYATHDQIQRMFTAFFPPESRKQAASKGKATAKEGDESIPAPAPLRRQLSLEFRQALPEGRLTMAQLQGHFMKHKNSPEDALANVEQLIATEANVRLSSLHLLLWLRRLGLGQYYTGFERGKLFTVEDIRDMGESDFAQYGVSVPAHAKRIARMLQGRKDMADQFAFVTSAQAEAFFLKFYGHDEVTIDSALATTSGTATTTHTPGSDAGTGVGSGAGAGAGAGAPPAPLLRRQQSLEAHDLAEVARSFGKAVPPVTLSLAQVMKLCAEHVDDPTGALEALPTVVHHTQQPVHIDPALVAGMAPSNDDLLESMGIRVVLTRLALPQYANAMLTQNVRTLRDLRGKKDSLASVGIKLLGHQLRVKQLLDAHPPTREDFSLVTSRAAARTAFVAATSAAAGDAADARAIRTAAAKFAEALPMPDGANGQGVSYFMIRDHCTTATTVNAVGFRDVDGTGSRAASTVAALVKYAVPAALDATLPADVVEPPALARALSLPMADVLRRLGLGAFVSGARKAGVRSTRDLLSKELGMCGVKHMGNTQRFRAFRAGDSHTLAGMQLLGDPSQAAAIFLSVFPDATPAQARQFGAAVPLGVSAWQVLDHCNAGQTDAAAAIATAGSVGVASTGADGGAGAGAGAGTGPAAAGKPSFNAESAIEPWLQAAGLGQYARTFKQQGFECVGHATSITTEQQKELGLVRLGDRKRFARAVSLAASQ